MDTRFCLPQAPRTAVVLGGLVEWEEGLAQAGVAVRSSGPVDVVVAPASSADEALVADSKTIVLEGRDGLRRLRAAGLHAQAVLVRPRIDQPQLLLPLRQSVAASYAIRHWSDGSTLRKLARNRLAAALAARGRLPEIEPIVAVATVAGGGLLPYVVQAAAPLGVPTDARWFMTCGHGDVLSRNAFHLFPAGAREPVWVLKFSRFPGYDEPFRRDEFGLALAANSARVVAQHAPRLLGRFQVDGLEASLETAAPGSRLRAVLRAPGSDRSKLRIVEEIAGWLLELARETAARPSALQEERHRLSMHVVPRWAERGVGSDIVAELPELPAVLQHNDMGAWNIVVGRAGFVAVDWESARRHGLPLWDLAYFLTDALVTLDETDTPDESTRLLLRGESSRSSLLFDWIARAARELEIPAPAVGPIVTLGWLHHGLSSSGRSATIEQLGGGESDVPAPVARLAPMWLSDPLLGVEWKAWRDR